MNKEDKQLERFTDDIYDKLLDYSGGPYTPFNRNVEMLEKDNGII